PPHPVPLPLRGGVGARRPGEEEVHWKGKIGRECAVGFGEHIFSSNRETREIRRSRTIGEQNESARNRGHAKVSNTENGERSFRCVFVWFAVPSTPSFQRSRG